MGSTSSTWDDVIYLSLLLVSIGLGPQLRRHVKAPNTRQYVSALAGFFLVVLVSGRAVWHPLTLVVINGIITLYANKRLSHWLSFTFCLGYLAFFRFCHNLFGTFFVVAPPPHTNAVQMILTLKMIGLCFDVRETYFRNNKKEKTKIESLESLYMNVQPSWTDIFCYSFCHAGVLTGPYYKYSTYWDSFHRPYVQHANIVDSFVRRIRVVPFYVILFLVFGYIFPLEYAESDDIFQRPLWYRVWYMTPLFFVFRMRIYIGFILSECQCITAGIGLYPSESQPKPGNGPTDLAILKKLDDDQSLLMTVKYDYETIRNIDEYGTEFGPSSKEALRGWNMTVQYWLAIYVYKRVPWKKYRVAITMLTSAFWHGVYPGYYLALLTVPFVLISESIMFKALAKPTASSNLRQRICQVAGNFFKLQAFAYMGIGFFLLTATSTLKYWKSIYFLGHITIAVFYVIGMAIITYNKLNKKTSKPVKNND